MLYDVAHDVSLRAIGGMIAGNVGLGPCLLWWAFVHCKQIMSHGEICSSPWPPKLRKDGKKKWLLDRDRQRQTDRSAGRGTAPLGTVHPMRDTRSPGLHIRLRDRVACGLQGCSCISNSYRKRAVLDFLMRTFFFFFSGGHLDIHSGYSSNFLPLLFFFVSYCWPQLPYD